MCNEKEKYFIYFIWCTGIGLVTLLKSQGEYDQLLVAYNSFKHKETSLFWNSQDKGTKNKKTGILAVSEPNTKCK